MSATPPYPNDSLRWVAAEVRYPQVGELGTNVPDGLRDRVQAEFPILEAGTQISISIGQVGQSPQPVVVHRFLRRDRLMSLTITRDAITLEASEYPGWDSFRRLFVSMVTALEQTARPAGILRIGLRFIDEVRLPEPPASPQAWQGWMSDRLVAPFLFDDGERVAATGTILLQFGTAPGHVTIFRAGPIPSGRAVQEEGPLRMPYRTPDGAFFLLDTDASWADPARLIPEFGAPQIEQTLNELHRPCHYLFEAAITERLRTEILMRPREDLRS